MCTTRTVRVVTELDLDGHDLTMWRCSGEDQEGNVAMWYEHEVGPFEQREVAVELVTAILRSLGALWIGDASTLELT